MPQDKIHMTLFTLADLRRPDALGALGAVLDGHPLLRPQRLDTRDPARREVDSAADALVADAPRLDPAKPHWWFFTRTGTPRLTGTLEVARGDSVSDLTITWPSAWFDRRERLDAIAQVFIALGGVLGALYGRAGLATMFRQRNDSLNRTRREPGRFSARLQADLARELPDVYWLNYFGPGFVEHWGERLDTLGVRRDHTPAGAVVIWATETPFVHDASVHAISDYAFKRPFYEALGFDTFMSETQRRGEPGEHVPALDVHRRLVVRGG
jgi:hypothetical protein